MVRPAQARKGVVSAFAVNCESWTLQQLAEIQRHLPNTNLVRSQLLSSAASKRCVKRAFGGLRRECRVFDPGSIASPVLMSTCVAVLRPRLLELARAARQIQLSDDHEQLVKTLESARDVDEAS